MTREQIRQQIRQQRAILQPDEIKKNSAQVMDYIIHFISFEAPLNIAFYLPHQGEVDPTPLIEHAWFEKNNCYLPALAPKQRQLVFLNYTPESALVLNQYGIPEVSYRTDECCDTKLLDIVFIPLVAFDTACQRIGMGAGYYDRTFHFKLSDPHAPPMLIGLAYEFQKVESIQPQPWDVPLNAVVTEQRIYTQP